MNQTGVRSTRSPRHARTRVGTVTAPRLPPGPMAEVERREGEIGPLGVSWLSWKMQELRAGAHTTIVVYVDNKGSVVWEPDGERGIYASYHWLDQRRNPIIWGGEFSRLPGPVAPGEQAEITLDVVAPIPSGPYRLSIDLVADGRCWFEEVGNPPLELACEIATRLEERTLAIRVRPGDERLLAETRSALARLDEPISDGDDAAVIAYLAPGCMPAPDWSRRVLDAHDEGYAAVGGSIEPVGGRRARRAARAALEPWAPGSGRNPAFAHPLLCPSAVADEPLPWLEEVLGLPRLAPRPPSIFDGRIALRYLLA